MKPRTQDNAGAHLGWGATKCGALESGGGGHHEQ